MTLRAFNALLTESKEVLLKKVKPEKCDEFAGEAESGDVDDVDGACEVDEDVKAVFMRRRELRGWRGCNLVDGMIVYGVTMLVFRRGSQGRAVM